MKKVLVTGSTGFIGAHLAHRLLAKGYWVRGIDILPPRKWAASEPNEFRRLDLRVFENAVRAVRGMDWVFGLAASMGGMGYIGKAHAEIIRDNTQINMNMLEAARLGGIKRYLFSSSACVYPIELQNSEEAPLLGEDDVYPAHPQDAYGWEKLHTEHVCRYYQDAGWLDTRVVRFHNVYGERGSWNDGREKAPAALCRKVASAKLAGRSEVEIWGDGEQRRSFMYVKDCIEGIMRLMESDFFAPLNLGRDRVVTINELVDIIADIAGVEVIKKHIEGPEGVRSRNSDNSLCKEVLGWSPLIPLEKGLVPTYRWIEEQIAC